MRSRRNIFRALVVLEAGVLAAVILFGVVHMKRTPERTDSTIADTQTKRNQITDEYEAENAAEKNIVAQETGSENRIRSVTFSNEVNSKLASMTIEEKVAQMFLTTPEALTHNDSVEVAGEGTRNAINAFPVGGLVYSSVNFKDQEQTRNLLQGVQQFSQERIGLPMFLAVEEIGGAAFSPLASANGYEIQKSPAEAGANGDPMEAAQASGAIASYLTEEGLNLNLMPLADLAAGASSAYDSKCYGSDAAIVSMMVAESINAHHTTRIQTATGAFPGKGAGNINTKVLTEWKDNDALPYQAAVDAGTDFIILGNVAYEPLTGDSETLCSLSEQAVSYLRNDMGYTGILMTDSLSEEAVSSRYSTAEAAVEAVKAGINTLYCPTDLDTAYQAVLNAVGSGEIPQDTVEQAAGYILTQKLEISGGTQQ